MPRDPRTPTDRRRFLRRSAAGLLATGAAGPGLARAAGTAAEDFWQAVPGTDPDAPARPAAAAPAPRVARSVAPPAPDRDARRLRLVNAHTGERFDGAYRVRDTYIDESLAKLAHLMRDHRADREHEIDPGLYDILHDLHARLDTDVPFRVLSGYRAPETNASLRKRSSGVARYSLHMEGRAADIHLPGTATSVLRREALALRAGGVGYYSSSGFVHVDTGDVRSWGA